MTTSRLLSVLALALAGVWDDAALAQDQPATTRGTVKVRSRVFNPFDIGQSRLTLSPFGIFSITNPTPFAVPTAGSPASSTDPLAAATSSGLVVDPSVGGGGGDPGIATNAVRPPFRPPTRSPWRPPPRPPFLPL